jgi:micrococcal nuclease
MTTLTALTRTVGADAMFDYKCKITRVVDGDTVDIDLDLGFKLSKKDRVRLSGIDTPESRTRNLAEKKLGLEAKEFLKAWCKKHKGDIIIHTESEGKYGRLLGALYSSESKQSVNDLMLEAGHAWPYDGGTKEKTFEELAARRAAYESRSE